jgi:hypothetical protein
MPQCTQKKEATCFRKKTRVARNICASPSQPCLSLDSLSSCLSIIPSPSLRSFPTPPLPTPPPLTPAASRSLAGERESLLLLDDAVPLPGCCVGWGGLLDAAVPLPPTRNAHDAAGSRGRPPEPGLIRPDSSEGLDLGVCSAEGGGIFGGDSVVFLGGRGGSRGVRGRRGRGSSEADLVLGNCGRFRVEGVGPS